MSEQSPSRALTPVRACEPSGHVFAREGPRGIFGGQFPAR
jgi:hypothetical protein